MDSITNKPTIVAVNVENDQLYDGWIECKQRYDKLMQSTSIEANSPKVVWNEPPEWFEPEAFQRAQELWKTYRAM